MVEEKEMFVWAWGVVKYFSCYTHFIIAGADDDEEILTVDMLCVDFC